MPYRKILSDPKVLRDVRRDPSFVAVRFVVEIEDPRLRVEVLGLGDVVFGRGDDREGREAELAVESAANLVVPLVFFLRSVPYCTMALASPSVRDGD